MPVHSVIQAMLDKARAAGVPALSAGSPEAARQLMAQARPVFGQGPAVGKREKIEIPTRGGAIPALLLRPVAAPLGLIVYLHGGGWVIGTPADFEALVRTLVVLTGCAALVPDYRLAPEAPFPAGLEDCEDAVLWAWAQRDAILGQAGPLVLAGDSAGGNLAAVVAGALGDRVRLAGQVLVYPVTDVPSADGSYREYGNGDVPLSSADMRWFFGHYAPQPRWTDPRIAPLRSPARTLPPTLVITAENDVLRDEGEAYAARLRAEGVEVTLRRYASMTHGFIRYHDLVDTAGLAVREMADDIVRFCRSAAD